MVYLSRLMTFLMMGLFLGGSAAHDFPAASLPSGLAAHASRFFFNTGSIYYNVSDGQGDVLDRTFLVQW